jgi:predicted nucleotidyltransferase
VAALVRLDKNSPLQISVDIKLRSAIAVEAARLMYDRVESEYFTAKIKAARRLCRTHVKPNDLPSNAEIRDQVQMFARLYEGESRHANLRAMRLAALALMRSLRRFRPRLIGSVMTGHIRKGSDIDLHVFSDSLDAVTSLLDEENYTYDVERKTITKHGETRTFIHIHIRDVHPFELTVYAENLGSYVFTSSITGKAIERASIAELEQLLEREYPGIDVEHEMTERAEAVDPHQIFKLLLMSLEHVKQNPVWHPEGDVLYHSLQVFEQAKDAQPWDEEFLLAALLHDVGKGIDPFDHVTAGVEALAEIVTPRTLWLVAHHMEAMELKAGTLGHKARRRLEAHEDFDDLMLLRDCDDAGRVPGAVVGSVDEALAFIRNLELDNAGK